MVEVASKGFTPKQLSQASMGVSAFSTVLGAYTSYTQGKAQRRIFEAQAKIDEINARIAEMQAEDAIKRGHEREGISRQKTKKIRGAQRAALAAQGIRVDVGSALDIQLETEDIGELDALTIRNNALREAFGFKAGAAGLRTEAGFKRTEGERAQARGVFEGTQTLLTSGAKFIGQYRDYLKEFG